MKVVLVPGLVERATPKGCLSVSKAAACSCRKRHRKLRRLDTDIITADGFYTMLARTGRQPAVAARKAGALP
jgi:hypothetical protein